MDTEYTEGGNLSRRGFLGLGAFAMAGTAVGGLVGCAPKDKAAAESEAASSRGSSGTTDWIGEPEAVDESKIIETLDAEVVVVGAGNGGMFAAASAAEEGARVVLLEKTGQVGSNCREWIGAVGSRLQKEKGVELDKNEVVEYLCFYASHRCDQRLIRLWADHSGETVDWLDDVIREQDPNSYVFFETDIVNLDHGVYKTFAIQHNVQNDSERLKSLDFVSKKIESLGVDVRTSTEMKRLIREDDGTGRVSAVIAEGQDGLVRFNASKGVIIATGGYCCNEEIMEARNKMAVDQCTALEAPGQMNNGDGIKAALWAGAAMDEQPTVMVFDRGGVPAGSKGGGAYSQPGIMTHIGSQPFLKVNKDGERFCNESVPYDFIYAAGTVQRDGVYCELWDANWVAQVEQFHTIACSRIIPSPTGGHAQIFNVESETGMMEETLIPAEVVVEADTIEGLAEKLQVPTAALVETVSRYNELCEKGVDEDFGKESYRMLPLTTPPYRAATLGGQLLCTLDGLRVNTDLQVLDTEHNAIPGLYAAGNDTGGFFANNYPELFPGVACGRTITFGRLAGKNVLKADV